MDSHHNYNLIHEEARRACKLLDMEPRSDVEAATNVSDRDEEAKQRKTQRKVVADLIRRTWLGASFKRLQHIMTLHAIGTETRDMPYADAQDRTQIVHNMAQYRAASKIAAVARGIVARKRLREKKDKHAQA